jgi:hypothetical protein
MGAARTCAVLRRERGASFTFRAGRRERWSALGM